MGALTAQPSSQMATSILGALETMAGLAMATTQHSSSQSRSEVTNVKINTDSWNSEGKTGCVLMCNGCRV